MILRTRLMGRWGVLIIISLVALGLRFIWLSDLSINRFVSTTSYWFCLFLILLVGVCFRSSYRVSEIWGWLVGRRLWLLVPVICGLLLVMHERFSFKVNYDEHVLLSISRSMHFEKEAGWAADGKLFKGGVYSMTVIADKRPVFFPFLVSIIHSATGYRPANAFVVNVFALGLALLSIYRIGWDYLGDRGGAIACGLFATIPLVAQNATGAGFDLLNVSLIALLLVLVRDYLDKPTDGRIGLVAMLSCCLANTRYESILYAIVPFLCMLLVYILKKHKQILTWPVVSVPFFCIPALLANGVFNSSDAFFQMKKEEFWGGVNYKHNLAHAVAYVFDPDRGGTNSLLLGGVGCISLVFLPIILMRYIKSKRPFTANNGAFFVVGFIMFVNVAIILGLSWGKWDDPTVARFTLPFWLLCILFSLIFLRAILDFGLRVNTGCVVGVVLMYAFFVATADAGLSRSTYRLKPAYMLERSIEKITNYDPWRRSLILASSALPYANYGYAASLLRDCKNLPEVVNRRIYDQVIIVAEYRRDPLSGKLMGDATMAQFEGARFTKIDDFMLDPFNQIIIAKIDSFPEEKVPAWKPSSDEESEGAYEKRIYELMP